MKYILLFLVLVAILAGAIITSANIYHKRDVRNCVVEGGSRERCEAKFK